MRKGSSAALQFLLVPSNFVFFKRHGTNSAINTDSIQGSCEEYQEDNLCLGGLCCCNPPVPRMVTPYETCAAAVGDVSMCTHVGNTLPDFPALQNNSLNKTHKHTLLWQWQLVETAWIMALWEPALLSSWDTDLKQHNLVPMTKAFWDISYIKRIIFLR